MSEKINVSVVGATGYGGLELIRLLAPHSKVELKYLVSKSTAGKKISEVWPHLEGVCDIELQDLDIKNVAEESDIVFFALPHCESQKLIPKVIGMTKVIDLSGDFRLKDSTEFEEFYNEKHLCSEVSDEFVYGLPEVNKDEIKDSSNIANPGCFATAVELALLPLKGHIKNAEIFAITGSTGSGKSPSEGTHHPIRNHNVKSYKVGIHQHLPEIAQTLDVDTDQLTFVPTSGPFSRGIHLTAFVEIDESSVDKCKDVEALFLDKYKDEFFVRVKGDIQLADVVGSNFCDVSVKEVNGKVVVQAVIDNLVKGAAGTAIQNMNLMFGFCETEGLDSLLTLFP